MRDVAVVGIGMNRWGELWEKSLRDIFVEAALLAMDDAGVSKIEALYVGSMAPGLFTGQEHLESLLADYLGQCPIPACRVESACASGGLAMRTGWMDVTVNDKGYRMGNVHGRRGHYRVCFRGQSSGAGNKPGRILNGRDLFCGNRV